MIDVVVVSWPRLRPSNPAATLCAHQTSCKLQGDAALTREVEAVAVRFLLLAC